MARHRVHVRKKKEFRRTIEQRQLELVQAVVKDVLLRQRVKVDQHATATHNPSSPPPFRKFVIKNVLENVGVGVDPAKRQKLSRRNIGLSARKLRLMVVDLIQELISLGLSPRSYEDVAILHRCLRQFIAEQKYVCPHTLTWWGRSRFTVRPEDGWENYLRRRHPELDSLLRSIWSESSPL